MEMESTLTVPTDVSFVSDRFPKYKLGSDNQVLEEPIKDNSGPTLKEVVEQETTQLSEQHKRLSVRDLASKFDKNLLVAAKFPEEVFILFLYGLDYSYQHINGPKFIFLVSIFVLTLKLANLKVMV